MRKQYLIIILFLSASCLFSGCAYWNELIAMSATAEGRGSLSVDDKIVIQVKQYLKTVVIDYDISAMELKSDYKIWISRSDIPPYTNYSVYYSGSATAGSISDINVDYNQNYSYVVLVYNPSNWYHSKPLDIILTN